MNPNPVSDVIKVNSGLSEHVVTALEDISARLPKLIQSGGIRSVLSTLEVYDMSVLKDTSDERIVERVFQIYAHLANSHV